MYVRSLALAEVLEIVPQKFEDERGFFSETYNEREINRIGLTLTFVQDNHSYSVHKGVLRGLHYQLPPKAQDKLVRVVKGAILDVAVDIRRSSVTFGQWVALEVAADRWNQIFIPKGFAHGFVTLTDHTEVIYKVSEYYSPEHDRSIRFDDPAIGIAWPSSIGELILSEKDRQAPPLSMATVFE
ncbi:dTDP-4-dehydrorhamnose 3,5-epimerase [Nitratireductor aestuarii]|uniref:dTDP-4-dehydrorhamnose 3,5-epimerase n=1 Tax=Nitratireductor aestuarii TaxID=1735103 RepID=A0A916S3S7_9HYPH|nr:dTDP-4-dehydrorhamnose 3,5-epimerase [Nitratireductor aestuarii]GGA82666.1 dTDP-4-dehydrorhamnose 3,5-epimerase [Nitratireductor aestuarii]